MDRESIDIGARWQKLLFNFVKYNDLFGSFFSFFFFNNTLFPHGNHGNQCSCLESTHNVQESDHSIFKMVQKNEDRKDIRGVLYFLFALALHSSSG
jgi:Neuraminidase (sialidase)